MKPSPLFISVFFYAVLAACTSPTKTATSPPAGDSTTPTASLTETYWKLIELRGRLITVNDNMRREPHLILKAAESKILGNAGCNGFGGTYNLKDGNRLSFSEVFATKMACPDMTVETEFLQVLSTADNYALTGDTLLLHKARMAPLARLVAVYLK